MAFPGGMGMPGMNNDTAGMSEQEKQMVKYMQMGMESCAGKTVMSGVMGAGLGGMFGLFMSSMRYDTPYTAQGAEIAALPFKQQLRAGMREMGRASYSSAKNFGKVGAIFSGTECVIEGFRAKSDLYNGVAAGCITGGALAAAAGPQAAAVGCAGFAVFSAAIDAYMRMPEDEKSRPIA
ncbi:Tim17-domain-containing protein [Mytilinidion resinicola]|uniref:Mitochondrial import inner membrane translocase subunit TIM22 n=1 Tax=Mytilinidion resinicola TaxID=574789 RepID=A0A6A6Z377_9PEZI|nr:Tim17-domain-containing protein [Mytilinidion resinicola]KAF2815622.1 Tim17-domain-containing protein [Mytilinidion resinicola]